MRRANGQDWRDAAIYAPLLLAERSLFAWEWLRRDAGYRAAWHEHWTDPSAASPPASTFGLLAFEPPDRTVPDARPLWRVESDAAVLRVARAAGLGAQDHVDLRELRDVALLHRSARHDHLLLSDGYRTVRLDGPSGLFDAGPVGLAYQVAGLGAAERPLRTLRRFLNLCRDGGFPQPPRSPEAKARRWILMLRAWDALASGADQRRIADVLLSPTVRASGWRSREPSLRSQVQRLVRSARQSANGGFWSLLR